MLSTHLRYTVVFALIVVVVVVVVVHVDLLPIKLLI